ncbi:hypothetical protein Bpfe_011715, partial [Biomphalaria pfeifferi]
SNFEGSYSSLSASAKVKDSTRDRRRPKVRNSKQLEAPTFDYVILPGTQSHFEQSCQTIIASRVGRGCRPQKRQGKQVKLTRKNSEKDKKSKNTCPQSIPSITSTNVNQVADETVQNGRDSRGCSSWHAGIEKRGCDLSKAPTSKLNKTDTAKRSFSYSTVSQTCDRSTLSINSLLSILTDKSVRYQPSKIYSQDPLGLDSLIVTYDMDPSVSLRNVTNVVKMKPTSTSARTGKTLFRDVCDFAQTRGYDLVLFRSDHRRSRNQPKINGSQKHSSKKLKIRMALGNRKCPSQVNELGQHQYCKESCPADSKETAAPSVAECEVINMNFVESAKKEIAMVRRVSKKLSNLGVVIPDCHISKGHHSKDTLEEESQVKDQVRIKTEEILSSAPLNEYKQYLSDVCIKIYQEQPFFIPNIVRLESETNDDIIDTNNKSVAKLKTSLPKLSEKTSKHYRMCNSLTAAIARERQLALKRNEQRLNAKVSSLDGRASRKHIKNSSTQSAEASMLTLQPCISVETFLAENCNNNALPELQLSLDDLQNDVSDIEEDEEGNREPHRRRDPSLDSCPMNKGEQLLNKHTATSGGFRLPMLLNSCKKRITVGSKHDESPPSSDPPIIYSEAYEKCSITKKAQHSKQVQIELETKSHFCNVIKERNFNAKRNIRTRKWPVRLSPVACNISSNGSHSINVQGDSQTETQTVVRMDKMTCKSNAFTSLLNQETHSLCITEDKRKTPGLITHAGERTHSPHTQKMSVYKEVCLKSPEIFFRALPDPSGMSVKSKETRFLPSLSQKVNTNFGGSNANPSASNTNNNSNTDGNPQSVTTESSKNLKPQRCSAKSSTSKTGKYLKSNKRNTKSYRSVIRKTDKNLKPPRCNANPCALNQNYNAPPKGQNSCRRALSQCEDKFIEDLDRELQKLIKEQNGRKQCSDVNTSNTTKRAGHYRKLRTENTGRSIYFRQTKKSNHTRKRTVENSETHEPSDSSELCSSVFQSCSGDHSSRATLSTFVAVDPCNNNVQEQHQGDGRAFQRPTAEGMNSGICPKEDSEAHCPVIETHWENYALRTGNNDVNRYFISNNPTNEQFGLVPTFISHQNPTEDSEAHCPVIDTHWENYALRTGNNDVNRDFISNNPTNEQFGLVPTFFSHQNPTEDPMDFEDAVNDDSKLLEHVQSSQGQLSQKLESLETFFGRKFNSLHNLVETNFKHTCHLIHRYHIRERDVPVSLFGLHQKQSQSNVVNSDTGNTMVEPGKVTASAGNDALGDNESTCFTNESGSCTTCASSNTTVRTGRRSTSTRASSETRRKHTRPRQRTASTGNAEHCQQKVDKAGKTLSIPQETSARYISSQHSRACRRRHAANGTPCHIVPHRSASSDHVTSASGKRKRESNDGSKNKQPAGKRKCVRFIKSSTSNNTKSKKLTPRKRKKKPVSRRVGKKGRGSNRNRSRNNTNDCQSKLLVPENCNQNYRTKCKKRKRQPLKRNKRKPKASTKEKTAYIITPVGRKNYYDGIKQRNARLMKHIKLLECQVKEHRQAKKKEDISTRFNRLVKHFPKKKIKMIEDIINRYLDETDQSLGRSSSSKSSVKSLVKSGRSKTTSDSSVKRGSRKDLRTSKSKAKNNQRSPKNECSCCCTNRTSNHKPKGAKAFKAVDSLILNRRRLRTQKDNSRNAYVERFIAADRAPNAVNKLIHSVHKAEGFKGVTRRNASIDLIGCETRHQRTDCSCDSSASSSRGIYPISTTSFTCHRIFLFSAINPIISSGPNSSSVSSGPKSNLNITVNDVRQNGAQKSSGSSQHQLQTPNDTQQAQCSASPSHLDVCSNSFKHTFCRIGSPYEGLNEPQLSPSLNESNSSFKANTFKPGHKLVPSKAEENILKPGGSSQELDFNQKPPNRTAKVVPSQGVINITKASSSNKGLDQQIDVTQKKLKASSSTKDQHIDATLNNSITSMQCIPPNVSENRRNPESSDHKRRTVSDKKSGPQKKVQSGLTASLWTGFQSQQKKSCAKKSHLCSPGENKLNQNLDLNSHKDDSHNNNETLTNAPEASLQSVNNEINNVRSASSSECVPQTLPCSARPNYINVGPHSFMPLRAPWNRKKPLTIQPALSLQDGADNGIDNEKHSLADERKLETERSPGEEGSFEQVQPYLKVNTPGIRTTWSYERRPGNTDSRKISSNSTEGQASSCRDCLSRSETESPSSNENESNLAVISSNKSNENDSNLAVISSNKSNKIDSNLAVISSNKSNKIDSNLAVISSNKSNENDSNLAVISSNKSNKIDSNLAVISSNKSKENDSNLAVISSNKSNENESNLAVISSNKSNENDSHLADTFANKSNENESNLAVISSNKSNENDSNKSNENDSNLADTLANKSNENDSNKSNENDSNLADTLANKSNENDSHLADTLANKSNENDSNLADTLANKSNENDSNKSNENDSNLADTLANKSNENDSHLADTFANKSNENDFNLADTFANKSNENDFNLADTSSNKSEVNLSRASNPTASTSQSNSAKDEHDTSSDTNLNDNAKNIAMRWSDTTRYIEHVQNYKTDDLVGASPQHPTSGQNLAVVYPGPSCFNTRHKNTIDPVTSEFYNKGPELVNGANAPCQAMLNSLTGAQTSLFTLSNALELLKFHTEESSDQPSSPDDEETSLQSSCSYFKRSFSNRKRPAHSPECLVPPCKVPRFNFTSSPDQMAPERHLSKSHRRSRYQVMREMKYWNERQRAKETPSLCASSIYVIETAKSTLGQQYDNSSDADSESSI